MEIIGIEYRKELGVPGEGAIGTKVSGSFHSLVLQNGGAEREERVVVQESEAQRVVEGDGCGGGRILRGGCGHRRGVGIRWRRFLRGCASGQGEKPQGENKRSSLPRYLLNRCRSVPGHGIRACESSRIGRSAEFGALGEGGCVQAHSDLARVARSENLVFSYLLYRPIVYKRPRWHTQQKAKRNC